MPRVIPFPPAEDARDGQAWAAFAAEDAAVRVPAALEARVMRAAQQALAEQRRADIERQRRVWHAAGAAVAASVLAAAAWSLAPASTPVPHETAIAAPAAAPAPVGPALKGRGGRVPMTNVEAGRVIDALPHATLAARPLFDPSNDAPARAPEAPHARWFSAGPIAHATSGGQMAQTAPAPPALEAQPAAPLSATPGAADPAHTALSARGFRGMFDPDVEQPDPADAGYRLELAHPAPPPAPETPPKK